MKSILAAIIAAILSIFGGHQALSHSASNAAAAVAASIAPAAFVVATSSTSTAVVSSTLATTTIVYQPVIERVIDQQSTSTAVTETELTHKLNALENKLTSLFYTGLNNIGSPATVSASPVSNSIASGGVWNAIAGSNKIDQLTGTSLTNVTVNGISGITSSEIPDLSGTYLSLSGGTTTGALSITDGGASSSATTGTERTTDGDFSTDPSSSWTLGSGWSWDSTNDRASHTGTGGPISVGNTQANYVLLATVPAISIVNGGIGYTNGDIVTISGGTGDATYTVSSVSSGQVTGLTQISGGTSYTTTAAGSAAATTGGTGSGLTVSINQIADAAPLSQTITTSPSDPTTNYTSITGATISGVTYRVSFTIAGYSGAGSVRADIGSVAANIYPYPSDYYKSNGTYTILLTSASSVVSFTPTADFVGEITNVSVVPDTPSSATVSVKNTDGSTALEIRPGGITGLNTFIGTGAGQNNTDGGVSPNVGKNTALGYQSLYSNTIGAQNTASGAYTLFSNTTGNSNAALGYRSLYSNTTGVNNTAAGASSLRFNTTGYENTAVGLSALYLNTTGYLNTAVGAIALYSNTTGIANTAVGDDALLDNTTGSYNTTVGSVASQYNTTGGGNVSVGGSALRFNTTGSNNTAVGYQSLYNNITTSKNTALGFQAMFYATSSQNSVAFGYGAGYGASAKESYQGLVALGYQAGRSLANGSDYNTLVGYQAGYGITTGNNNIWIGTATSSTGIANLTTGSQNILIGNNISLPSPTNSGQLDIGNIIYGTGITGTGSTLSTGNIGIATTTPWRTFSVNGTVGLAGLTTDTADSKVLCLTANNEVVANAGTSCITSSERFKNTIEPLTATSGLAEVLQLNPVSFQFNSDIGIPGTQVGFIAEQVNQIDPRLVVLDASSTPFTVRYENLTAILAKAIQEIATVTGAFRDDLIAWLGDATNGIIDLFAQNGHFSNELCVGSTCVTPAQFQAMVAAVGQSSTSAGASSSDLATPDTSAATDTPPTITINGNNPAYVNIGDSYADLGATITGPQTALNLGIKTFLNGALVSNITIDTSAVATNTIDYVVSDQNGLTSTSTRRVVIEAADAPSISPSIDTATSTDSIAASTTPTTDTTTSAETSTSQ